ncbi:MAG: recombination mediator RecR [Vampirovibrionales bacterium]
MSFAPALQALIEAYQKLPTIGPKTAQRLAFHTLKQSDTWVNHFAQVLQEAKARIHPCPVCFNWSDTSPCDICTDPERQDARLCVVSEVPHIHAIERADPFTGRFHVLGGLISPLEGLTPERLTIRPLLERVLKLEGTLEEVILALPPSTEGDTTCLYLARLLKQHLPNLQVTRIAFGLPVGGDLDYADHLTLSRSFQGRLPMQ